MIYDLTIREEDRQQIIAGLSLSLAGSMVGKQMKHKVYTSYLHRHILFGFIDTQKLYQLALQIELAPGFSFLTDEFEKQKSLMSSMRRIYRSFETILKDNPVKSELDEFQQTQLEMEIIGRTLPLQLNSYDLSKLSTGKKSVIRKKDFNPCIRVIAVPKGSDTEPTTALLHKLTMAQGLISTTLVYEI